jgi:hypothetical protein
MVTWKAVSENTGVIILFNIVVLVCKRCLLQKVSNTIALQFELLFKVRRLRCLGFYHSVLNMNLCLFFNI